MKRRPRTARLSPQGQLPFRKQMMRDVAPPE
jgi:hypothetical protein